jgi:Membrane carboxypeptidase/penicillin-binding protein PbpC
MLKGPSLYRPDKHPEAAKRRRDSVIRFLEERGVFTKEEARLALLEPLPSHWIQPPLRAFHFAEMVLVSAGKSGRVETTLDLGVQTKLEAIMNRAVAAFPNTVTAAAGIVDNKTGGLIAWVGNARFGKGSRSSWVDCGRALRSPGSVLKPLAYLAAFDKGILTPHLCSRTPPRLFRACPAQFRPDLQRGGKRSGSTYGFLKRAGSPRSTYGRPR